ncbi:MAG: DUF349 domain-containing protein [Flavobacteriales bacterium]|nr:DUF349 domain-containing protein [Flavobacteriales bacterium]MEB2341777.1 DUF349 domain-containing protein [Flavobacteriia bacterium]
MASKSELIARLEELLRESDIEGSSEAVESLKESYEALVAAEKTEAEARAAEAAQEEAAAVAEEPAEPAPGPPPAPTPKMPVEVPKPIESAPLHSEDDKRFKQLLDAFNTKVNDLRRQRLKEENDNLEAKRGVMGELRALIANEENIGNAFQRFNELGEKWRAIGAIPQQHFRELQQEYNQLREDFFYHIRIYKELRDHDLRKNTALKQALVSDMQAVQRVDSVREAEQLVREYQDKWHQIGPVLREEREAVNDAFWNATRTVYDRINDYYKARRAEHEANLASKQALVEKVNELAKQAVDLDAQQWKTLTDQVLELQNAWKNIGFATKKDNERVWLEFREACNAFFGKKHAHYGAIKAQFKAARDRKESLIGQAEKLKDSTAWRQTADKLKDLQRQWKEVGSAGTRDEQKLWARFREACDAFFQARKENFAQQDAEQAAHALVKEQLIAEIEAFSLSGNRNSDLESLKAFSVRWLEGGHVSPRQYEQLSARYRAAMDKQYDQLKVNVDERRRMTFHNRVQEMASAPDGKDRIERESRFVKRKIEELEAEVRQGEENMGKFSFKSAAGEAMRKEMERSLERTRQQIERLRQEHKQLRSQLRSPKAEAADAAPEGPKS